MTGSFSGVKETLSSNYTKPVTTFPEVNSDEKRPFERQNGDSVVSILKFSSLISVLQLSVHALTFYDLRITVHLQETNHLKG
jgi:hypothetical protein